MTSESESSACAAPILWITGLSGVGKSSLARALIARLHLQGLRPLLLDGDLLRDTLEAGGDPVSHAPQERERRAWRIARLACMAASQGVPVVVATISLIHVVQQWSRGTGLPYAEIWLRAGLTVLRDRQPALYSQVAPMHVVGLDLPAQYPEHAELVIDQDFRHDHMQSQVDQALALWHRLESTKQ